ncbi:MAG TPA: hypothetical protein P5513_02025 [Candidatus Diapherotrites archaeon]|jgi:uncharacterized membrane protein|nr:hypothetical protein [Candidatus Diapherotrites archaeon]
MKEKNVNAWLKILSILFYIFGIVQIFAGILYLFKSKLISLFIPQLTTTIMSQIPYVYFVLNAILLIIIGIIIIITANGIWKHKQWARYTGIFILLIFIIEQISNIAKLGSLAQIGAGNLVLIFIQLIINILFLIFLANNKTVKKLFKKK